MAKKKERKPLVFLTEDQKLQVMKDYDESKMSATFVSDKWGISKSALYKIKETYWPVYQTTKDTMNNRDKIMTINSVKIDSSRKMALIESKAGQVISRVLNLIEHKLDIEEKRMKGEHLEMKLSEKDIVTVQDLTRFFQVAAPYFLRPHDNAPVEAGTTTKKHSFITQILNQQINNYGNKKDSDTGIATQ